MSRALPPLVLLLLGLLTLAWWLPNRPVPMASVPGRLNSVSFAPFRAGQSPLEGVFPTAAEVEADIALLAPHVRAIRTYAAIGGDYDVAALAAKHGVKLWQGIWLGADRAQNRREIARAVEVARRYPDTVERVIVGNEVLLRRDLLPEELIAAIETVRAAVRQPVTYADVWEFWEQFPEVAAHVDIVTIHLLPYWEDVPTGVDRAIAHVVTTWRRMAALFPGKKVAIGETGWPSRGRPRADAAPGAVAQARFMRGFLQAAQAEGFDYNLIEAFDQGWKYRHEGTVGANWGLWTEAREQKSALAGPVAEDPLWLWHAGLSGLFGLLLLGFGLVGPGLGRAAQFQLAVLAMALGGAFGYAVAGSWPVAYDAYLFVAAIGNLAGQMVMAVLLMRRAHAILAGERPGWRNGAQATAAMRALLRWRFPVGWPDGLLDDLAFLFVWTAAVLQLLLVLDPRYRDFPLPVFAVPLVAVAARAWLRDLPRGGGGREEAWAGGVLALSALAGAVREGPLNPASLVWTVAALVLATPPLLRLSRG